MPRLTEASRLLRRHEIANAALRCVARHGFARTTIADVIVESGHSAGSIYSHFDGKADLVRFAFKSEMAKRQAKLETLISTRGNQLAPIDMITDVLSQLDRDRESKVLLQIWAATATEPELADLIRVNDEQLLRVMDRGITPWARARAENSAAAGCLAHDTNTAVLALMRGYLVQIALDSPPDLSNFLRLVDGVFDDGVYRAVGTSHA